MKRIAVVFLLLIISLHGMPMGQDAWTLRNPLPTSANLIDIAYGNGKYVSIGSYGTIMTSSDGITWVTRTSGTIQDLNEILWADSLFITVGNKGTILTSSDGISWHDKTVQGTKLTKIIWANNTFVIIGNNGAIITSGDGITWSPQNTGITQKLYDVIWGDSMFVAVGDSIVATSSDGIAWTRRWYGSKTLIGVTKNDSIFIAISHGYSVSKTEDDCAIYSSPDGINWALRTKFQIATSVHDVKWVKNQFVIAGYCNCIVSPDGVSWTTIHIKSNVHYSNILLANNLLIILGQDGSIANSTDGVVWTINTPENIRGLNSIIWNDSQYVAVGPLGAIFTSSDGAIWVSHSQYLPVISLYSLAYSIIWGNNKFVIGGNITSPDGITWSGSNSGVASEFICMALGNGKMVAGIDDHNNIYKDTSRIYSSADGQTWAYTCVGKEHKLSGLTWANNQFVIVGYRYYSDSSKIYTSPDGINWTDHSPGTYSMLSSVTWGKNQYVAVGGYNIFIHPSEAGTILTSPDGITWTSRVSGSSKNLSKVVWGGNQFVAVGNSGTILTSFDGITWTTRTTGISVNLYGVAWGGDQFVAVGDSGTILSSKDGSLWVRQPTGTAAGLMDVTWANNMFVAIGEGDVILTLHAASIVPSPKLISAVASDNSIKGAGIDSDDYIVLTFDRSVDSIQTITGAMIDSLFILNYGHTWLSGTGSINQIQWNTAKNQLVIMLSTMISKPTIAIGDTITYQNQKIVLTGSFDPPTTVASSQLNFKSRDAQDMRVQVFSLQGKLIAQKNISIYDRDAIENGSYAIYRNFSKGIYIVQMLGATTMSKLVVIK